MALSATKLKEVLEDMPASELFARATQNLNERRSTLAFQASIARTNTIQAVNELKEINAELEQLVETARAVSCGLNRAVGHMENEIENNHELAESLLAVLGGTRVTIDTVEEAEPEIEVIGEGKLVVPFGTD